MVTVVEHLVQALLSLPNPDKEKAIRELLEDTDCRKVAAGVFAEGFVKKLLETNYDEQAGDSKSSEHKIASRGKGKKERGRKLRNDYISELQQNGIQIQQVDSVWAKTSSDLWVAIPTATMEWRPGRWFLGLSEDKVRERISRGVIVILLCQAASGTRLDFVIPPHKVEEILPKLSRSKGELKFNIKKVDGRYQLVIPHDNTFDVTDCKGAVSFLQG